MDIEGPSFHGSYNYHDSHGPSYEEPCHCSISRELAHSEVIGAGRHGGSLKSGDPVLNPSSDPPRYHKVEKHDDVEKLNTPAVIMDLRAAESTKTKCDSEEGKVDKGGRKDICTEEIDTLHLDAGIVSNSGWKCSDNARVKEGADLKWKYGIVSAEMMISEPPQECAGMDECNKVLREGELYECTIPDEGMQGTLCPSDICISKTQLQQPTPGSHGSQNLSCLSEEKLTTIGGPSKMLKPVHVEGADSEPLFKSKSEPSQESSGVYKPSQEEGATFLPEGGPVVSSAVGGDGWVYYNAYRQLTTPYTIDALKEGFAVGYLPGELFLYYRQAGKYSEPVELKSIVGGAPAVIETGNVISQVPLQQTSWQVNSNREVSSVPSDRSQSA